MKKNAPNLIFSSQLLYIFLCIVWNIIGLSRIANGEQALGPTASIKVIILLLTIASVLCISHYKKWRIWYAIFSVVTFLLATSAIAGAFLKDPSLWPAEYWRFSGVALNLIGVLNFVMLIKCTKK